MKYWRFFAAVLAVCLLLTACGGDPAAMPTDEVEAGQPAETDAPALAAKKEKGVSVQLSELSAIEPAESYEAVTQYFSEAAVWRGRVTRGNSFAAVEESAAPAAADTPMDAAEGGAGYDGAFEGTGTNVQVAGVDEADTVKTDGSYIYILQEDGFTILSAAGADTEQLSHTPVIEVDADDGYAYIRSLFVGEDRVAVLYNLNAWGEDENGDWYDTEQAHVAVYDTVDKRAPKRIADVAQDGSILDARLTDGRIYLVSVRYVWGIGSEEDPVRILPQVYDGEDGTVLTPEQIYLCPNPSNDAFTLVSSVAMEDGEQTDVISFTDATSTVYMDRTGLYLARTVMNTGKSEPYAENQYTVVDCTEEAETEIRRLSVEDGKLSLSATGTVPGNLLNQFSLDVHDGYLRLATTVSPSAYSIYTDEAYGWDNYVWYDSDTDNRITILDGDLQPVGKLEHLGRNERIYSVRFMGKVGYMVTFESIDPVFTIDLSDPTAPRLEGELEVAGVSQYLHLYKEDQLFGFGQAVLDGGVTDGLQLSMFDVSDLQNIGVLAQKQLDDRYSAALYDHKALLIDPQRNLIGFGVDDYNYVLFTFTGSDFDEKGRFAVDYMPYDARGLCIGECLYVCSSGTVYAVDLGTMEVLASVTNAVG